MNMTKTNNKITVTSEIGTPAPPVGTYPDSGFWKGCSVQSSGLASFEDIVHLLETIRRKNYDYYASSCFIFFDPKIMTV